jgi:hypothetical protein
MAWYLIKHRDNFTFLLCPSFYLFAVYFATPTVAYAVERQMNVE